MKEQISSQGNRTPTLGVLYLLYPEVNQSQKEKPVRALKRILSRFPGNKHIIYINNAAPEDFSIKISENEYEIGGNNSLWEFSGWQKGIDFLKKNDLSYDACLLVNDKFLCNSFFHRRLVNQKALECTLRHNAMIGQPMCLPVRGEILGNRMIPYIRTHIFMLSKTAVDALGAFSSMTEELIERFFIPRFDASIPLFRQDAPLSQEIRNFVFSHVTSKWSRQRPYTAENFEILRDKAIAILNAFLLSLRANQLGVPLISYQHAPVFLSNGFSIEQINQAWLKDFRNRVSSADINELWLNNVPAYHHLPERKIVFTWANVSDLLLGNQSQFNHL